MKKSYYKKTNNKKLKYIRERYIDRDFVYISSEWIKWAKRYMNRRKKKKNKQQKDIEE